MFEAEMKRNGITMTDLADEEVLSNILKKLSVPSLDELYAAIGYGGQTAIRAVNRVKDEIQKLKKPEKKTVLDRITEAAERRTQRPQKAVHGVLVEGLDNCLIRFSKCCSPVPGDEIVGFITRGAGVSIHRTNCMNYQRQHMAPGSDGRWIKVTWAENTTDLYMATLNIVAKERSGLIMDVATVLNSLNAKVRGINAQDVGNGQSTANVTLEVRDLAEVHTIYNKLCSVRGVIEIRRGGS
jgi:GTP pyrophosphokinase